MKAEHQRIRQQVREGYLNLRRSFAPLVELSEDDKCTSDTHEAANQYEDEEVQVEIVNLSTREMANKKHLLGENSTATDQCTNEEEMGDWQSILKSKKKKSKLCDTNRVPGMDLEEDLTEETETIGMDEEEEDSSECLNKKLLTDSRDLNKYRSKRDFDRLKKNSTLKQLKKSKVFKIKERLDKQANRKRIRRDQKNTMRSLPKHVRNQKQKTSRENRCRYRKGRLMNKKQLRKNMKQSNA